MSVEISEYIRPLLCPKCGSDEVRAIDKMPRSVKCECLACSHSWSSSSRAAAEAWKRTEAKRASSNGW
ncbi:hypothetical protein DW203_18650 [Citrobacter portucalensis]|uniref:hypothetical protein n=1 Tax=Citrobacter portucalensis TaxID=1639133 RepID=UPI000E53F186|nr:hypothetical protein [Citrobacter portucalensis]RHH45604.1 hypothetical protein DW203_18650 [Citrobacter portucalensis]